MKTVTQECLNCSVVFEAEARYVARGHGKYCSRKCSSEHRKTNKIVKTPNCKCAQCDKPLYRNNTKLKASKSGLMFCNRKCKEQAQRIGGIEAIQPSHYNSTTSYRAIAFRAYPNECNVCGYSKCSAALEVHHKDRDRNNNSLPNLVILCRNCHAEEHHNN